MGRTRRYRCLRKRQRNESQLPDSQTHHDLIKFLVNRGWRNFNGLTVSSFSTTGRGLYCKEQLAENDMIIELPFKCLISYWTIESDDKFIELFAQDKMRNFNGMIPFQAFMAYYVAYQILLDHESEWTTYIKSLPKEFSMPYFCKKSELYQLPNYILEKIVEQNDVIKNNYQHLQSMQSNSISEKITLDLFKYSYFVCNSRSVYIKSRCIEPLVDRELFFKELLSDEPNMALAPMLDLLNHSDKATTRCQLSHSEESIKNNARKILNGDIKLSYMLFTSNSRNKYEEIFINYGTYNNTKLLIEYGFILPKNQNDFLEFTLEDINNYIQTHNDLKLLTIQRHKYKFIRDHNLNEHMYIDRNDGLNHNFQAVLAILLLPQNTYNLTQVAFGNELNFDCIKIYAVGIIERKQVEVERMLNGLKLCDELSESAQVCLNYFLESQKLIEEVLEYIKSL